MNSEPILYYSRYCKYCKNFILQLKQNNLLDYFTKKICIDNPQIKSHLPSFLKEVPTIVTDDYDKPMSSDVAFKWITFRIKEQQQNKKDDDGKSCTPGDPECFTFNDSFDNFDSINNNSTFEEQLKGAEKGSTGSINYDSFSVMKPELQNNKNISGNNSDFDKNLEKLQKMREMDNNFNNTNYNGNQPLRHG